MRRVLPCGPRAWLLETDGDPVALADALRASAPVGLIDVVAGATTVLVTADRPDDLAPWLASVEPAPGAADAGAPVVELSVVYDGEDLGAVAEATGLSRDEVVARHSAATYRCAFCGFAPGFGYLRGLDRRLHLPRRPTPRTRVPAGAVAIAAEYTAVYPSASPGGWHLLGRTDAALWDAGRDPPALVGPGTTVRFVAT